MQYPGGKNHCYQKIINLIPPHDIYIETHLGSGAVMRHKRLAPGYSTGLDINPNVIAMAQTWPFDPDGPAVTFLHKDAAQFLQTIKSEPNIFIYCDPPYVMSSRRQDRPIYEYEYTDSQHIELLTILNQLDCLVMISGYRSKLYDQMLAGWHIETFESITRGGAMATEYLWMNYPKPSQLHDYSHLGDDFRDRERIKRKITRWVKGLQRLPDLERNAIIEAITTSDDVGQHR